MDYIVKVQQIIETSPLNEFAKAIVLALIMRTMNDSAIEGASYTIEEALLKREIIVEIARQMEDVMPTISSKLNEVLGKKGYAFHVSRGRYNEEGKFTKEFEFIPSEDRNEEVFTIWYGGPQLSPKIAHITEPAFAYTKK